MNKLDLERKKNRLLYRELFFEADKTFKEQLNKLKKDISCSQCNVCCQIRYSQLSPEEIFELSIQEDVVSQEYIKLFIPYGAKESFNYQKNNKINLELNNEQALKTNSSYVSKILSKSEDSVYFYYCKNFKEEKSQENIKFLSNCSKSQQNEKSFLCRSLPSSVTAILPESCSFKKWQEICVDKIQNEIKPDIYAKISEITEYRHNFSCSRTGTCCRLACSEYNFEELKLKAQKGDIFAGQFTSVFIPYKSLEEARKVFPDYVDLVRETLDPDEQIYFYHCPHITDDNICTIYQKRPQICRDFPDNPLSILPPICGFYEWKEEVMVAAMTLHAMSYIYKFYLEKVEMVL